MLEPCYHGNQFYLEKHWKLFNVAPLDGILSLSQECKTKKTAKGVHEL